MVRDRTNCSLAGELGPGIQIDRQQLIRFNVIAPVTFLDVVRGQVHQANARANTGPGKISRTNDIDIKRIARMRFNIAIIRDCGSMQNYVRIRCGDILRDCFSIAHIKRRARWRIQRSVKLEKLGSQESGTAR